MGATARAAAPPRAQRPTIRTRRGWFASGARAAAALALLAAPLGTARAQTTSSQLWGEIDGYWTPTSVLAPLRFLATAAFTRSEEVDARELTGGLHAGIVTAWGSARLGVNITRSPSPNEYREEKVVAELNAARPITVGWRFSSRTRIEQRWIFGAPSQRYRERVRSNCRPATQPRR